MTYWGVQHVKVTVTTNLRVQNASKFSSSNPDFAHSPWPAQKQRERIKRFFLLTNAAPVRRPSTDRILSARHSRRLGVGFDIAKSGHHKVSLFLRYRRFRPSGEYFTINPTNNYCSSCDASFVLFRVVISPSHRYIIVTDAFTCFDLAAGMSKHVKSPSASHSPPALKQTAALPLTVGKAILRLIGNLPDDVGNQWLTISEIRDIIILAGVDVDITLEHIQYLLQRQNRDGIMAKTFYGHDATTNSPVPYYRHSKHSAETSTPLDDHYSVNGRPLRNPLRHPPEKYFQHQSECKDDLSSSTLILLKSSSDTPRFFQK